MRLSFVPAALLALVWAGAADACCFFKCCKKSDVATVSPDKRATAPSLVIVSVGGFTPNSSNEITQLIPAGTVIVVVQKDPDTLNPDLYKRQLASTIADMKFNMVRSRRIQTTAGGVINELEYEMGVTGIPHGRNDSLQSLR